MPKFGIQHDFWALPRGVIFNPKNILQIWVKKWGVKANLEVFQKIIFSGEGGFPYLLTKPQICSLFCKLPLQHGGTLQCF